MSQNAHENQRDKAELGLIKILLCIAAGFVGLAFVFSIIILLNEAKFFQGSSSYDLAKIGAWGDTVGGVLNPLLSFLALIGLLWTIRLQSDELSLSRKELSLTRQELEGSRKANETLADAAQQQNIETAFFQLFNLLQTNLQTITVQAGGHFQSREVSGPLAFKSLADEVLRIITASMSDPNGGATIFGPTHVLKTGGWTDILQQHDSLVSAQVYLFKEAYTEVYSKNNANLGRYFRILYNVLRFLSDKENILSNDSFDTYFKILRASISDYELFFIMEKK